MADGAVRSRQREGGGDRALRAVVSTLMWLWTALVAIVWLPLLSLVWIATAPRDPGRYTAGRWFRRAAMLAVLPNPLWRFTTSGLRVHDPRRPYIAVANHESIVDIFLLSHLPWEMKWVSKAEVGKLPVMGWMMRMAGDVLVKRDDPASRYGSVQQIRDRLSKNVSVMIFPEGTRSRTGDLLPFRNGAFRIAIETGTPILPIAVAGTAPALTKGSLVMGRSRAEARVLEPIETAGLTLEDMPALRDRVRAIITEARAELRRDLGIGTAEGGRTASSTAADGSAADGSIAGR
jgi:1-acyl-sn-glycerol-3-phosphate acyltransferase